MIWDIIKELIALILAILFVSLLLLYIGFEIRQIVAILLILVFAGVIVTLFEFW